MRSPGHRLAALALALLGSGAAACTGEDLAAGQSQGPELEPFRLGRVHVVLEPEADPNEDPYDDLDAFEVTARFAFVRGLDEDFVRAHIDMPVLAADVVAPNACAPSDSLTTVSAADTSESPSRGELLLVDAGDLRMQIGSNDAGTAFEVPISLVPDLLPYMSGVEYLYYSDVLPSDLPADGGAAVVVESKSSPSEELPTFRAEGTVPPALALHVTEDDLQELARDALVLRWQGKGATDEDIVTLRLTGLQSGEPSGTELTCVLYDVGQARLSFDTLRALGLTLDGDALRVTVSRLHAASFDAGDFVGSELLVERREKLLLPLR